MTACKRRGWLSVIGVAGLPRCSLCAIVAAIGGTENYLASVRILKYLPPRITRTGTKRRYFVDDSVPVGEGAGVDTLVLATVTSHAAVHILPSRHH